MQAVRPCAFLHTLALTNQRSAYSVIRKGKNVAFSAHRDKVVQHYTMQRPVQNLSDQCTGPACFKFVHPRSVEVKIGMNPA